jgi:hypothetical protein
MNDELEGMWQETVVKVLSRRVGRKLNQDIRSQAEIRTRYPCANLLQILWWRKKNRKTLSRIEPSHLSKQPPAFWLSFSQLLWIVHILFLKRCFYVKFWGYNEEKYALLK